MDTFPLELTCKERSILATVEESQKLLHLLSLKYCNLTQLKIRCESDYESPIHWSADVRNVLQEEIKEEKE